MENKDKDPNGDRPNINQSVNNYGTNSGHMGHTFNINMSQPAPPANLPADPVQKGIWKASVVKLVSEGKTEEALAEILKIGPSDSVKNQVVLLSSRFSQLRIERIAGVLDKELEWQELNRIREGILSLIAGF